MMTYNHYLQGFLFAVSGTGSTIDTPLKVAKYGISSVISLVDDNLIEKTREYYCVLFGKRYKKLKDRAERITAYLNLINKKVNEQIAEIKLQSFDDKTSDLTKYFNFLPESSELRQEYLEMMKCVDLEKKIELQDALKQKVRPGSIDVNIMTKLDHYDDDRLKSDAITALVGHAESDLCCNTGLVLSAGLNMVLKGQIAEYEKFFVKQNGGIDIRVILKVSDYSSGATQAKFLAKKGIWVSEFRLESGLNCGGHAFATDGLLLGPIIEEFQNKKEALREELFSRMNKALRKKEKKEVSSVPQTLITAQGGVATAEEHRMLLDYYKVDAVGYASLLLVVPEVTSVDKETLMSLVNSSLRDFTMDHFASPLMVPFRNFTKSSSQQKIARDIREGKPSKTICINGFLKYNTEFTIKPACTASKFYKEKKLEQLVGEGISKERINEILSVECICRELGSSSLIDKGLVEKSTPVSICPNLTLAYFQGPYTLEEIIFHIFGEINLLKVERPHMFITELELYVEYMEKKITMKKMEDFYLNLCKSINYYTSWAKKQLPWAELDKFLKELARLNELAKNIFSRWEKEIKK